MTISSNVNSNIFSLPTEMLKGILKYTDTSSFRVCKTFYANFFPAIVERGNQSYLKNKIEKITYQKKDASMQEVMQTLYEKIIKSYASNQSRSIHFEKEIVATIFKGKFVSTETKGKTIEQIFTGHFSSFEQFEELERQLEALDLVKLGQTLPEFQAYYEKELQGKSLTEQAEATRAWLNSHPDKTNAITSLSLMDNRLTKLPKEISLFANLEILDISRNNLQELPAEIGKLKKLQEIQADYNKLNSLPAEVGNLEQMNNLVLDNNNLSVLPVELSKFENLRWLSITCNPIINLPKEILNLPNLNQVQVDFTQQKFLPIKHAQPLSNGKGVIFESEVTNYDTPAQAEKYRQKYLRVANTAFLHQKRSFDKDLNLVVTEKETTDELMTDVAN